MKRIFRNNKKIIIIALLFCMPLFLYYQNNAIQVTRVNLEFEKIPDNFDGYKILQISDLHSKSFGKNQKYLVKKIRKCMPDLIVVTGDIIDHKKYNEDTCIDLLTQIQDIAPIYFVTGNHEAWSMKFNLFEKKLLNSGVEVLRNETKKIKIGNDTITIVGIDDPYFFVGCEFNDKLEELTKDIKKNEFIILLSHRPELLQVYSSKNIDLVFSGHAHGGQIRLPFIGGLVAPDQGYFPKYTSGYYKDNDTIMVVSRGLGNSIIPQRIFNRPELVLVILQNDDRIK